MIREPGTPADEHNRHPRTIGEDSSSQKKLKEKMSEPKHVHGAKQNQTRPSDYTTFQTRSATRWRQPQHPHVAAVPRAELPERTHARRSPGAGTQPRGESDPRTQPAAVGRDGVRKGKGEVQRGVSMQRARLRRDEGSRREEEVGEWAHLLKVGGPGKGFAQVGGRPGEWVAAALQARRQDEQLQVRGSVLGDFVEGQRRMHPVVHTRFDVVPRQRVRAARREGGGEAGGRYGMVGGMAGSDGSASGRGWSVGGAGDCEVLISGGSAMATPAAHRSSGGAGEGGVNGAAGEAREVGAKLGAGIAAGTWGGGAVG